MRDAGFSLSEKHPRSSAGGDTGRAAQYGGRQPDIRHAVPETHTGQAARVITAGSRLPHPSGPGRPCRLAACPRAQTTGVPARAVRSPARRPESSRLHGNEWPRLADQHHWGTRLPLFHRAQPFRIAKSRVQAITRFAGHIGWHGPNVRNSESEATRTPENALITITSSKSHQGLALNNCFPGIICPIAQF